MSVDEPTDPFSVAVVGRRVLAEHEAGHPCWRCTADTVATCGEAQWWRSQLAAAAS
ncbi:hypothetical protein [Micromonospora yangpuensis]|uniref:Uncharacterized protein n=1 Tax=Micromonospora yangpuensis TaxID=683228 RepID=A0A1C6VEB6_9ACTN|nr:hypothetical protein [Micromonospora yangpuensis]SCL64678.1 hypothetical protein GA0070617_5530 [Micromonospora yangpuensis]